MESATINHVVKWAGKVRPNIYKGKNINKGCVEDH